MSVCLCSFRALSRSRTSSSKTLAPFLYQTATIQQHNPISRRHTSNPSRSGRPGYDVPFEGEELPPTVDEAKVQRSTTITGSERAAFEKLYKNTKRAEEQGLNEHELDQIADEYYEDDDDSSKDKPSESLDSLFDAVLSGTMTKPSHPFTPARARRQGSSIDLETLAKDVLAPEADQQKRRRKEEAMQKQDRIKKLRLSEKKRIRALFDAAPTDQALWAVLEKEVFSVIRGMDLENGSGMINLKSKSKLKSLPKLSLFRHRGELSPGDPAVVYYNYSSHLIAAASTLRRNFPASPLMFNILPTVKNLGRSSYALGASTGLYMVLIGTAFHQNNSYPQICSLLQDMENGGIEYDFGVLAFVDKILSTHMGADRGHYGRSLQAVVKLELYREGAQKLRSWRAAIAKRLGDVPDAKAKGKNFKKAEYKAGFSPSARQRTDDDMARPAHMKLGRGCVGVDANEYIPLVEDAQPFEELGMPAPAPAPAPAPNVEMDMDMGMHADIEGFMRDEAEPEPETESPVTETTASPSTDEQQERSTSDDQDARNRHV